MTRKQICVVGSANIDLSFQAERLPQPGETVAGRSLHQCMGGKGANQAVAAARLGARVAFIACVGDDGFGEQAIAAYDAEGIETSNVRRVAGQPTGTAAILVDDNAENCIVVVAGANGELDAERVAAASETINACDLLLCQLETPIEAAVEAFSLARTVNTRTLLTPAPAKHVTDELLGLVDFCLPNQTEISQLAGMSIESEADAIRGAQSLRDRGVGTVLLTLGKRGVLVVDDAGATPIAANNVEAIDTTGAGDAFTAAFAVAISEGFDTRESAQRAAKAAAISVTRIGTQTSFPTRAEVDW